MTQSPYRWTGLFGIALYLLVLIEIPFYFWYTPTASGTPPTTIILMRILIDLLVCLGLAGFFSGLRNIVAIHAPAYKWVGDFLFACGLIFSAVSFVADSIQAGSVWAPHVNPVDPTAVGYGSEGALLIYGPINRLLNSAILFAGSWLILKSRLFPRWTGWLALLVGFYNLAFIPTLFFMTTPLDFYSVNGWNIPIAAGWFFLWIFILSIFILRKKLKSA